MWQGLVWLAIGLWVLLWSALCWALRQALLRGAHPGGEWVHEGLGWLERWRIPAWLADWLPMGGITALKAALVDLVARVEALGQWLPMLGGWLDALLWLAWAAGVAVLLMLGLVCSVAVAAVLRSRRPARAPAPPPPPPAPQPPA